VRDGANPSEILLARIFKGLDPPASFKGLSGALLTTRCSSSWDCKDKLLYLWHTPYAWLSLQTASCNACLSASLLHSLHRSSSCFLKSFGFTKKNPTFAQCTIEEFLSLRVFRNSGFSSNSPTLQNMLVMCTLAPAQFPPGRFLQSVQQLCVMLTPAQNFLQGIKQPWVIISLVYPPGMFFSDSKDFRYTLLALATKFPILCCALLAHPKEPRTIQQNSQIKNLYPYPADEI